jgi:predicted DNA-binding transcriptional regulator AlpA
MALRKMHRRKAVLDAFQFSNSTLYQKIEDGTFPAPVKIGAQMVAWFEDELEAVQRGEWHQGWKPEVASSVPQEGLGAVEPGSRRSARAGEQ